MLKKKTAIAMCLGLSLVTGNAFAAKEDENKASSFGEQILDIAKDKFINAAGGQISSLLINAIFGGGGPSYVNLTEESLQAIQDRVHTELVDTAEVEFFSQIRSLEESLVYYNATALNNNPDINVLGSLLIKANEITAHHALNSSYNDEYYYLADSYALVASLSMSIYVERHIQGFVPASFVKAQAHKLANQLDGLLRAKKSADLPLREYCTVLTHPYEQYREEECLLKDPHNNVHASVILEEPNPYAREDLEEWLVEQEVTEKQYYSDRFENIEDVIAKLRKF